jgi:hypothetical protein
MDIDNLETALHNWECMVQERLGDVEGWNYIREFVATTLKTQCEESVRFVASSNKLLANLGFEQVKLGRVQKK